MDSQHTSCGFLQSQTQPASQQILSENQTDMKYGLFDAAFRFRLLAAAAMLVLIIGYWYFNIAKPEKVSSVEQPVAAESSPDTTPRPPDFSQFVGSTRCAECHADQAADYEASGHARTFHSAADSPVPDMDGRSFFDKRREATFQYHATAGEVSVSLPEVFGEDRFPLQFGFGSGDNAVTFMSLIPSASEGTVGIEHRATWYSATNEFDLTPGHGQLQPGQEVEHFGRLIKGNDLHRCFECHTTTYRLLNQDVVRLRPNVGCESCHGAGADHVASMESGQEELQLRFASSTRKLDDELQLCARCHRSPSEIPAQDLVPTNWKLVRFQPVGLTQSKCFTQTAGGLRCSTCHDPHQHARKRPRMDYERICLDCHQPNSAMTSCPESPDSNCVACHMPKIQVVPEIGFHDHWIRVRSADDPQPMDVHEKDMLHE